MRSYQLSHLVVTWFFIFSLVQRCVSFTWSGCEHFARILPKVEVKTSTRAFKTAYKMVLAEKSSIPKTQGSNGLFTSSSPVTKRVVPASWDGKIRFKVVYVVLESQYQSSLTQACLSINNGDENIAIEAVGYLLEELRNPTVLEQFRNDVADANIFIGSLIFVQELADKVRPTVRQIH